MPVGKLKDGNPWGILATRSMSGPKIATITEATTTAVKAAGSLGIKREIAKINSSAPTPMMVAAQFQSPIWEMADHNFSKVLPSVTSTPNSLPNWPTMIWIDIPVIKPAMTAFEMKFVIHPMRAKPATRKTSPAAIAKAAVIATAVS